MSRPVIESVELRKLVDFAEASVVEGRRGGLVAISPARARAWQHNPHADPDDAALLVARLDGRCVGYLGIVPGRLRIEGRDERVDWLTTFYVPRCWRATGVGTLLLLGACGLGRTLAVSGAPAAEARTYGKLGFVSPGVVEYYVLDFSERNPFAPLLGALRRLAAETGLQTRIFELGARAAARITRSCAMPLLRTILAPSRRVDTRPLAGLRDADFERVADQRHPVRFSRDASVIDWMLHHPWVTTNGLEELPGYRFDDFREDAGYRLLEIHDERGAQGFALLSLTTTRGVREVRLLDHHLRDVADAPRLLPSIVLDHAAHYGAERVVLPESCRPAIGGASLPRRLFETRRRRTWVRPGRAAAALRTLLPDLKLDYCDGDACFA